ncbi:MAG TPA: hypothetical protein VMY78_05935 [Solirubrobacteraceae bacterium]|nr:hypothetical protein [Solirubrobacteraceae bacterium]
MPTTSHPRRAASARLRAGLGTALALLATLPFAASAQAAVTEVVPAGAGLTMPEGIAVTTNGSVWVTDQALGVCRVDTTAVPVALAESQYCKPEPADTDPLATPRLGPGTAHQMAFDPASSNFFVAEGDSHGTGVWRMHWDEGSDIIDSAFKIASAPDRVFALALGTGPGGVYVDFSSRDSAAIYRIENADTAALGGPTTVVGSSINAGVPSMTNLDGQLYIAEGGGVTRIAAPGPGAPTAVQVPGFPRVAGSIPNALAADPANGRVYAGTTNVNDIDTVDVLTPGNGDVSAYESGFAFVTGLAVAPNGNLLIADDPPTAAEAPESLGQSHLYEAALHTAHLPTVTITSGPAVYSSATAASFTYSSLVSATFSCRLDGAAWEPCGSGPTSSKPYGDLGDGTHLFEVRGSDDGPLTAYFFTVDTLAPVASVDSTDAEKVGARDALRVRFSADEFGVTFACALDGQPIAVCEPPVWLRGFAVGDHTFTVTATDLAGNVGAPAAWTFTRTAPPPVVQEDKPSSGDGGSSGPGPGPDSSGPGSAAEQASGSSIPTASCKPIAAPARKASYKLRGRVLTARIVPPAGARTAKLTFRQSNRHAIKVALRTLKHTKAQDVRIVLTATQAARLRSHRASMAIAYGTCATTLGAARNLTSAR